MNVNWYQTLDDPAAALFTVGVVAELLGVDVQVVRRYDSEGVINPRRSPGRQRRYSRLEVIRIARAVGLAQQGIPIIGILRILELEDQLSEQAASTEPGE